MNNGSLLQSLDLFEYTHSWLNWFSVKDEQTKFEKKFLVQNNIYNIDSVEWTEMKGSSKCIS